MVTYTSSDDDDGWGLVLASRASVDALEIASFDPEVIAFRAGLPDGKLLPRSKAHHWADGFLFKEGVTTLSVDRFVGTSAENGFSPKIETVKEPLLLELPRSTHGALAEGTLGRLIALAHRLSDQFGWGHQGAAWWVLTGDSALAMRKISMAIELGPYSDRARAPRTWNRVKIEARAELPASYIADAHADARRTVAEDQETLTLKGAPVGRKQLTAMMFAVNRNDGRSWEKILSEWEVKICKKHPDWRYKSFRNFARDARETYQRVMGRPWKHGRLAEVNDGEA